MKLFKLNIKYKLLTAFSNAAIFLRVDSLSANIDSNYLISSFSFSIKLPFKVARSFIEAFLEISSFSDLRPLSI